MFIADYQIVPSMYCFDRVQVRKHKKKRVNKKWRKRYGYRDIPWKKAYIDTANKKIFMHPTMAEKVKLVLQARGILMPEPPKGE